MKPRMKTTAITPERAIDEGRRLLDELGLVTCAGRLVEAPPAVFVVLGDVVAEPEPEPEPGTWLFVLGDGLFVPGEGLTGTGLLEAAGTWEVIATETVGLGAVWVATTTLCVAGCGITVAVEVDCPSSGWALCAEQNEINGANSGFTYVCSVAFVESPFATTQLLQAPSSDSKAEPLAQRAGVLPILCASIKQLLQTA